MSDRWSCEDVRALAPELALGIASGDDRARALEHLADCAACRARLEELSRVADELLMLAPAQEPPAGFESRVLGRLEPPPRPRRRRRILVPAFAAGAAALAAAAALWVATKEDRDLASRYRATLAEANGKYLTAEPLSAPGGARAGTVFGYEGEPSWVLVTVYEDSRPEPGRYQVEVITAEGERVGIGPIEVTRDGGSGGESIPIDFHHVSEVRLLGPGRGNVLQAEF